MAREQDLHRRAGMGNPVWRLVKAVRESGLIGAGRRVRNALIATRVARDGEGFDSSRHVETSTGVDLSELRISAPNKAHGVEYAPTPANLWRTLTGVVNGDLWDYSLVDYGCGKGRVLILASEQPWQRIIGVEFSDELAELAQLNMEAACPGDARLKVFRQDAASFEPPSGNVVAFFYNPFGPQVLQSALDRLAEKGRRGDRVWIIYYNPVHRDMIEASGAVRRRYGLGARLKFAISSWHQVAAYELLTGRE